MVEISIFSLSGLIDLLTTITYLFLSFFFTGLFFWIQWKIILIYAWIGKSMYPVLIKVYKKYVAMKHLEKKDSFKDKV